MFKYFRTGDPALFVYVTDEDHGDPVIFCLFDEVERTLANLSNTSGRGPGVVAVYRLYRIGNDYVRFQLVGFGKYRFNVRLVEKV